MVTDEDAPVLEIPDGAIEVPLKTLNLAERVGLETARSAVAQAQAQLDATMKVLADVIRSVGLEPEKDYDIDDEGHVFPKS